MTRPAVASGHEATTRVARELLAAGGNAFDAAVGAAITSSIAEPALSSLGGGGFLMAKPASGRPELWDFFTDAPGLGRDAPPRKLDFRTIDVDFRGSRQLFQIGLGSAAVPGCLAGLLAAHDALGRLPLADVIAPAAGFARDGIPLNRTQAFVLEILAPIFTEFPDSAAIYAPGGRLLGEGDRFAIPAFADFLERLPAEGSDALYRGELANHIHEDMAAAGGILTRHDLAAYRVERRAPLQGIALGAEFFLNPAPSWGGELLLFSLQMLDGLDRVVWNSPEHLAQVAAVMEEVDRQREADAGLDLAAGLLRVSKGTTHVSVADVDGNLAALSTSNGQGSGYIVPGTGIMLNNMLGEDDLMPDGIGSVPAGCRIASMMCPGLALRKDGGAFGFGSGGSKRIRTALLQVLCHRLGFDRSTSEAVDAPRIHWDGEILQVEPGFSRDVVTRLASHWNVNEWRETNVYFGGVHAVDDAGEAAADPRRQGDAWVG